MIVRFMVQIMEPAQGYLVQSGLGAPHTWAMPKDRILIPIASASWPTAPDSEESVLLTVYRVNERHAIATIPVGVVARVTAGDPHGRILLELSGAELRQARELLALASVETANYLDSEDVAALQLVPEPRDAHACLEFAVGHLRVGVTITPPPGGVGAPVRSIALRCRGYQLPLPHFDCLA